MNTQKNSTEQETGAVPDESPDRSDPEIKDPEPTDFRKHIWLLVAILGTVILAGIVAAIWGAQTPTMRDENGKTPETTSHFYGKTNAVEFTDLDDHVDCRGVRGHDETSNLIGFTLKPVIRIFTFLGAVVPVWADDLWVPRAVLP